jgi:uncharacterized membrane protein YfcA
MVTDLLSLLILCGSLFFLYKAYGSNKNKNKHIAFINLAVGIILAIFSIIGFLRIRNLIVYGVIIVAYYIAIGVYMANRRKQIALLKAKTQSSNKPNFQNSKKRKK